MSANFHGGRRRNDDGMATNRSSSKSPSSKSSSSFRFSRGDKYKLSPSSKSRGLGGGLCCGHAFNDDGNDSEEGGDPYGNVQRGEAFDIVMVENDKGQLFHGSNFLVSFSGNLVKNIENGGQQQRIILEVEDGRHRQNQHPANENNRTTDIAGRAWFPIVHTKDPSMESRRGGGGEGDKSDNNFDEELFWGCCHLSSGNAIPGRLSTLNSNNSNGGHGLEMEDPTSTLRRYLRPGRNPIRYLLLDDKRVIGVAPANIFLWNYTDSVIISDIDGTITKSNIRGLIDTVVTDTYEHCHLGICDLLTQVSTERQPSTIITRVVYVTSRLLGLARQTRNLLTDLRQGNSSLPEGPLLGFGGSMSQFLVMELLSKSTHHFKSETLWRQVVQPFRDARRTSNNNNSSSSSNNSSSSGNSSDPYDQRDNVGVTNLFVAGFGNSWMDVQAYHMVGINLSRIFKINERSQIVTFDKNQKKDGEEDHDKEGGDDDDDEGQRKQLNPKISTTTAMTMINQEEDTIGVFNFPPKSWYKDRRGTVFTGYTDPRLMATVSLHTNHAVL